ncbi:MAG: translocation/assembly module TamB domain-containing protein, partial [Bacteroidota bacterium]
LFGLEGKVALEAFTVRGKLDNPEISGVGHFTDAKFGIDYFRTTYSFNGKIEFDKDRFNFPTIELYDPYGNHADLHGSIRHRGLKEFDFSLQLDEMRNFLIMDTRKGDNDLFYGTLFVKDGIADISGDLDQLVVTAFASSGRNSRLKIPISDYNQYERPEFIRFVGDEEANQAKARVGLKGFELNLTALATEDVEVELIFDEKVGDIMKGRGNGTLTLKINEQGEFTMVGDYQIAQGEYLFTAQNVLNKKFTVESGGSLTWSGDPYSANMNVNAVYPVQADVSALLGSSVSERIPVNVRMNLKGALLSPEIALDVDLPSISQQNAESIVSRLQGIKYDQQELNKQVFSLMVFKRFAPIGGFGSDLAGVGVASSVSELISNQFNYWLSQATQDKLSVNIGTNNFQDVDFLVSAKLFNDRVTFERDGTLVSSNSDFSVGNLRLIIKLLPRPGEGALDIRPPELAVEVFNRESTDFDNLNQSQLSNNNQTGVGIFFKKDFDNLQELFQGRRKKKKGEKP